MPGRQIPHGGKGCGGKGCGGKGCGGKGCGANAIRSRMHRGDRRLLVMSLGPNPTAMAQSKNCRSDFPRV
ncbi:MAG: hypothetical protein ACK5JM_00675, partial [Rhodoblastus sp.]